MAFREHVGLELTQASEGQCVAVLRAGEQHLNAHGTVHGGVLATLIDAAMGGAVASTGSEGTPVTVSLTVTYLEPGQPGQLQARARVRKRGRRLVVVEAEVVQDDTAVAEALATFALS